VASAGLAWGLANESAQVNKLLTTTSWLYVQKIRINWVTLHIIADFGSKRAEKYVEAPTPPPVPTLSLALAHLPLWAEIAA